MDSAGNKDRIAVVVSDVTLIAVVEVIAESYRINWGLLREVTDFPTVDRTRKDAKKRQVP